MINISIFSTVSEIWTFKVHFKSRKVLWEFSSFSWIKPLCSWFSSLSSQFLNHSPLYLLNCNNTPEISVTSALIDPIFAWFESHFTLSDLEWRPPPSLNLMEKMKPWKTRRYVFLCFSPVNFHWSSYFVRCPNFGPLYLMTMQNPLAFRLIFLLRQLWSFHHYLLECADLPTWG